MSINDALRPFPAILDTGHSHHFAIAARHMERWSGVALKQIGDAKVGTERLPQYAARLFLHGNKRGSRMLSGWNHPLDMDQGISVIPDSSPLAPRLPILGLRALMTNRLSLVIDGKRRQVTSSSS